MLSRTLRRTLLDQKHALPPTFLLPWTAGLHLTSTPSELLDPPPPRSSIATPSSRSASETNTSSIVRSSTSPVQLSQSVRELLPLLRAQGQIYAAAHIHGKAYLVTQGDTVRLPALLKDVEVGDTIRLNRALYIGSRDLTLKSAAAKPTFNQPASQAEITPQEHDVADQVAAHYIPHIAKGKHSYLDERLFVCRASVIGVESEPLRIMEKTKRRQRHVKHVKSKHRFTILKISELRIRSLEEIDNGILD